MYKKKKKSLLLHLKEMKKKNEINTFILLFFPFVFLPLSLPFHLCPLLIGCLHAVFLLADCYLSCFSEFFFFFFLSLATASVGVELISHLKK